MSHTGRNIAILLIVIFLVVILAFVLFRTPVGTQISYPNVQVSGTITTVGTGTHPIRVDFTSSSGQVYSTQVSSGQYSLTLPNNQDYAVTVTWSGFAGATGTCNGGALNLNIASGSYTWDTSC
ncbi:MAG: hypothetical protein ACYCQJ_05390 [Nitrososphaerales archaeon]